jgi:hypothetical protein
MHAGWSLRDEPLLKTPGERRPLPTRFGWVGEQFSGIVKSTKSALPPTPARRAIFILARVG